MTTTIVPERLARLDTITLDKGAHESPEHGMCFIEFADWLAGGKGRDNAPTVSPVIRAYGIALNDEWDLEQRQKLRPYGPRVVGTAGDGQDEARSYLALDWLIRTYTPAWLDLAGFTVEAKALRDLRRIVDLVAAQAAWPVVKDARNEAAAAGAAAWAAAWAAAGDAAWAAAWDAAWAALKPTVTILQDSALDLLDRLIDPSAVA